MVRTSDQRLVVGNRVHTRARLLTSDVKCRRMYGANWKVKKISGTVLRVIKLTVNGRKATDVEVKWNLVDNAKIVTLRLTNIKSGEAPLDNIEDSAEIEGQMAEISEQIPAVTSSDTPNDTVTPNNEEHILDVTMSTSSRDSGPVIEINGREWVRKEVTMQINGYICRRPWKVIGPVDEIASEGHHPSHMTPFDCFMWMFPQGHLSEMVYSTNHRLEQRDLPITTKGELLRFFGVLVLLTRCQFGNRRSLWSNRSVSKYLSPPSFGNAMSRQRFEVIRQNIAFTGYATDVSNMDDRWGLVKGFVDAINDHRATFVKPSERICVEESISRWYGLGGSWIVVGIPHYVALDRKPESGCELKTASCGKSGIIIRIEMTISADDNASRDFESDTNHGAAVLLRLVEAWFHTNRVVCADSIFASVETAKKLLDKGLKFTGVVKTAKRDYPMEYLSRLEIADKGQHVTMVSQNPDLMAVMWIDRDRRYFISSTGTTEPGHENYRERWRSRNGIAVRESIEIAIPMVCEEYYDTCSMIDRHNRCRQDDLGLEKKFEVKDWATRVNTSLLAICIVDSWKLYSGSKGAQSMSPNDFYCQLADSLIDNRLDKMTLRQRESDTELMEENMEFGSGVGLHLTPTKRKRKDSSGTVTNAAYQSRCSICKNTKKSKFVCSGCYSYFHKEVYICHHETGRDCFKKHTDSVHNLSYQGKLY